jgi:hypothetical protein
MHLASGEEHVRGDLLSRSCSDLYREAGTTAD